MSDDGYVGTGVLRAARQPSSLKEGESAGLVTGKICVEKATLSIGYGR